MKNDNLAKRIESNGEDYHLLGRYREVTTKNIDALRSGRLYFSSPCYFNDPFDSVAYIDENRLIGSITAHIENGIRTGYVPKSVFQMPDYLAKLTLKEFEFEPFRGRFLDYVKKAAQYLQKCVSENTKVICFSESLLSSLMWAHYADENKGFELIYDYEMLKKANVYDSTHNTLSEKTILRKVKYFQKTPDRGQLFYDELPYHMFPFIRKKEDAAFYLQLLFTKHIEWEYEKEWRLCVIGEDVLLEDRASYISADPIAILFGTRMSEEDKNKIYLATKGKEIAYFDVSLVNSHNYQGLYIKESYLNRG